MKIWHGYGSEHSMNLVMIGHFKSVDDANKTNQLIEQFTEELRDKIDIGMSSERYGDDILKFLYDAKCHIIRPSELEHFLYDFSTKVEDNKLILTTEESEVSAFFKLMIEHGARVEIYSTHNYPDSKYGRGK